MGNFGNLGKSFGIPAIEEGEVWGEGGDDDEDSDLVSESVECLGDLRRSSSDCWEGGCSSTC